ncbi:transglutaminase-like domain-containing protein [Dyadobacter arcticus]|uniref:Regulator of sirC expression with transglutaminase-like and TPR domain n=1 Tax=Dyadobacter arcticus TaxID=1078754 RepID=A0ABX0UKB6_9BACT|nr:transglutaminase-like domain-containing protein [Dyadobacter arcticus]NIJ53463.1 regulator of sirC expression with transglutaminase-like and TPR domain [Dyadobacter arcticus]
MDQREIKALISLLDDEDHEVSQHVEGKILSLGGNVIPFLETEWEESFNSIVQRKIEELIHELQLSIMIERLQSWKNGGGLDLLEGLWIIATYHYPDLSIEKLKTNIEQLFYDIWIQFQEEMNPVDQVKRINSIFFGTMNFAANTKNFHSPSNSMINVVLESKRGNPITLCVIYLLIARKLGMPVYGVNLPNLFVLTYKNDKTQFYINVFNRGIIFSKTDIDHYIAQLNIKSKDIFYQPCTNLEIIQRVLRNLILSYEKTSEQDKIKEIEKILKSTIDDQDDH